MSTFRRLIGTAQKALDSQTSSRSHSGSSADWRSFVRSATDALTGDDTPQRSSRAAGTSPTAHGPAAGIPTTSMPSVGDRRAFSDSFPAQEAATGTSGSGAAQLTAEDRRAIARYDYLVRTAEPEQLERVHREAFERLTPAQRAQLSGAMREELPEGERPRTESPQDLARSATRLGVLDPRRLTRLLGRSTSSDGRADGARRSGGLGRAALGAGAVGLGAAGLGAAGSLLAVVAGGAVLTSVGGSLLEAAIGDGIDVDALAPDLGEQLAGFDGLGIEGLEGVDGLGGIADGGWVEDATGWASDGTGLATDELGGGVADLGGQLTGLGDQISDLGLGDLFGR